MKKTFKVGVDAGNISALDFGYIEENGGSKNDFCEYIELENGIYDVSLEVKNSWNGNVSKKGKVKITSGVLAIGDSCYYFSKKHQPVWEKFINKTDCLRNHGDKGIALSTGGDGGFNVEVEYNKLEG